MAKKADSVSRFELDGEVLEIDIGTLSFGEIEFVETYFDRGMNQVDWDSGRGMLAIAALAKARKDRVPILRAMDDLRDVEVGALKEAPKPKRPTKTPETSGTKD